MRGGYKTAICGDELICTTMTKRASHTSTVTLNVWQRVWQRYWRWTQQGRMHRAGGLWRLTRYKSRLIGHESARDFQSSHGSTRPGDELLPHSLARRGRRPHGRHRRYAKPSPSQAATVRDCRSWHRAGGVHGRRSVSERVAWGASTVSTSVDEGQYIIASSARPLIVTSTDRTDRPHTVPRTTSMQPRHAMISWPSTIINRKLRRGKWRHRDVT